MMGQAYDVLCLNKFCWSVHAQDCVTVAEDGGAPTSLVSVAVTGNNVDLSLSYAVLDVFLL